MTKTNLSGSKMVSLLFAAAALVACGDIPEEGGELGDGDSMGEEELGEPGEDGWNGDDDDDGADSDGNGGDEDPSDDEPGAGGDGGGDLDRDPWMVAGGGCGEADPCDCPNADKKMCGEDPTCEPVDGVFHAYSADADPLVSAHEGGHSFWLPDFFCDGGEAKLNFRTGLLRIEDDGSARLDGELVIVDDGCDGSWIGRIFATHIGFDALEDGVQPRRELQDPDVTQPPEVTDEWQYFQMRAGEAFIYADDNTVFATLTHRPVDLTYGFQVGDTANGRNLKFGASGWFKWVVQRDGKCEHGEGDINLNLYEACVE